MLWYSCLSRLAFSHSHSAWCKRNPMHAHTSRKPLLCNSFIKMSKSLHLHQVTHNTHPFQCLNVRHPSSVPVYINQAYKLQLQCILNAVAHFFFLVCLTAYKSITATFKQVQKCNTAEASEHITKNISSMTERDITSSYAKYMKCVTKC